MTIDYKKALDFMLEYTTYECSKEHYACIQALKKQVPKKPIHVHEEYEEHDWGRDENGEIDTWAYDYGYCNGPICTRCYHSECVHCNEDWEIDPTEPCVIDKDICPVCGSELNSKYKYCDECGQALDWSEHNGRT